MESILQLYKKHGGSEYFGEVVSKTTHMIQTVIASQNNNEPDYLVLACLLHDIGHFLEDDNMNGLGVIEHGKIGADYLRNLNMYEKVCCLVENHVLAKNIWFLNMIIIIINYHMLQKKHSNTKVVK